MFRVYFVKFTQKLFYICKNTKVFRFIVEYTDNAAANRNCIQDSCSQKIAHKTNENKGNEKKTLCLHVYTLVFRMVIQPKTHHF